MKQLVLVDSISEQRGFFSSVNLTLLTILYCMKNNIQPIVSDSVLSLYGSRFKRIRPFSEFFGTAYETPISKSTETIEIAWVHNNQLLSFNDPLVIQDLRLINNVLLSNITPQILEVINTAPDCLNNFFDICVHYRGCDYLKNVPVDHQPNLQPEEFMANIEKLIIGRKFFVATDDDKFLDLLIEKGLDPIYFKDVYRKGPGRGAHIRSRLQRLGLPSLISQNRKGVEVLRDCFWLSKSNHYIGSNSNLMYYSSLLNPNQVSNNVNKYSSN